MTLNARLKGSHSRSSRPRRSAMRVAVAVSGFLLHLSALPANAQEPAGRLDALQQLNGSVTSLAGRVSQSVVQVLVTSYGPVEAHTRADTDLVIGRQRSMGSGVVIDTGGYIMTNAHVVSNARRVEVVLPGRVSSEGGVRWLVKARGRTVDATIVGVAREIDLALLKIDDALPALPIADYDALRQGELVFAFGSPEGLRNSMTMGIVSAVARQPDPDNPLVFVQTDASINHGNSGGPLVNARGELVGINTFTLADSGGSQGLGFAIPGALVQMAYPKLRRYGHLHRGEIGILLQTITPTLASGPRGTENRESGRPSDRTERAIHVSRVRARVGHVMKERSAAFRRAAGASRSASLSGERSRRSAESLALQRAGRTSHGCVTVTV